MTRTDLKPLNSAILTTAWCSVAIAPQAMAQDASPKYEAKVPLSILTPDTVETERLGKLEFFDGMPSQSTIDKTYDFLDVSRGAQAFLSGLPAASVYAILEGFKDAGMEPGDMGITEDLMDARSLFLTPNTTTPIP